MLVNPGLNASELEHQQKTHLDLKQETVLLVGKVMPGRSTKKPTCCDFLEKGHEVLQCQGDCGCTVHQRYCDKETELKKGSSAFLSCSFNLKLLA